MPSLISAGELDRQASSRLEVEQEVIRSDRVPIAVELQAYVVNDGTLRAVRGRTLHEWVDGDFAFVDMGSNQIAPVRRPVGLVGRGLGSRFLTHNRVQGVVGKSCPGIEGRTIGRELTLMARSHL